MTILLCIISIHYYIIVLQENLCDLIIFLLQQEGLVPHVNTLLNVDTFRMVEKLIVVINYLTS